EVFLVPRLLADEEHVGMRRTLAEDGLGRVTPEVAALAVLRGPLERRQAAVVGHPGSGGRLRGARRAARRLSTARRQSPPTSETVLPKNLEPSDPERAR